MIALFEKQLQRRAQHRVAFLIADATAILEWIPQRLDHLGPGFSEGLSTRLYSASESFYYPVVIYCPVGNFREDNVASTVVVAGVGMIPFAKPGASPSYDEMGT